MILASALAEIADCTWPLAMMFGVGFLLVAHLESRGEQYPSTAYKYMRLAAQTFLLGFFVLWLRWRHFL